MYTANTIRAIILRSTSSTTKTIFCTKDISTAQFTVETGDWSKNNPAAQKEVLDKITRFATMSGIDLAGAEIGESSAGWHAGTDPLEHSTVAYYREDASGDTGDLLYFFKKSNSTFWNRIHVPRDESLWIPNDYVAITREQFNRKIAPKS